MTKQRRKKGDSLLPITGSTVERAVVTRRDPSPVKPLNEAQRLYMAMIRSHVLTIGLGPAGTGKTFVAAAMAAEQLAAKTIQRVVITRPAVEAGEMLGYLPGELEEKFEPYLRPLRDVFDRKLGKGFVDYLLKLGGIEAVPLAFMRGHTYENCWVILDEAQNATPSQMKMFLTRIGEGTTVIVNGDVSQKDIRGLSGLEDAAKRLGGLKSVGVYTFQRGDVVRSGFVQDVLDRYAVYNEAANDEGPQPWRKWGEISS